ncbi:hypothetical protein CRG98_044817 [Punica granatum]|uniref:Uncharacterized protein n=1 Tax=Punica granatum TaxID=22663 RepID=A0A2I0HTL1_PUNGR|nr:hypothetical protein CRG98_044817 [Punica granatum]
MYSVRHRRKSKGNEGSGPPSDNPNPSTVVAGTHGRRRRPRCRGQGCRLVAPTPNRLGTSDWRGRGHRLESSIDSRLGPPSGDPDPSTEVASTHSGRQRP